VGFLDNMPFVLCSWLQPPARVRVVVAGGVVAAPAVAAVAPTVAAVAAVASDVSVAFVSVAVVVGCCCGTSYRVCSLS
jgi:hypothetical protein